LPNCKATPLSKTTRDLYTHTHIDIEISSCRTIVGIGSLAKNQPAMPSHSCRASKLAKCQHDTHGDSKTCVGATSLAAVPASWEHPDCHCWMATSCWPVLEAPLHRCTHAQQSGRIGSERCRFRNSRGTQKAQHAPMHSCVCIGTSCIPKSGAYRTRASRKLRPGPGRMVNSSAHLRTKVLNAPRCSP